MKRIHSFARHSAAGSTFGSLLGICLLSLLLTGCWDRTEINDIAIVLASSIDMEGEDFLIGLQVALPGQLGGSSGGGGGTGGSQPYHIYAEKGATARQALTKLQQRISRELFFAHRRIILINEELARTRKSSMTDILLQHPENRLTSHLIITKGKALDLLKTQPKLERFSGEAIREIAVSPGVIKMNLKDLLLLSFHSEGDTIAIYMGTEADQTSDGEDKPTEVGILGYALFKHGQMVDVFTGDAAKGLTWLTRQPPLLDYRIEDQGVQLTVLVDQGMTHIRPVLHGNRIDFETTIRARATIAEEESLLDVLSEERMRKLEERLNEQIKQSVLQAVEIIQKHQVDPVGLETLVHKTHPELWRTKFSKQWDSYVKQAQFPVKVNCSIGRIGIFSDTDRKK